MTRLYIILEEKTSLNKFCYLHGYKLLDNISHKKIPSNIIEKFLYRNNLNFSFKDNGYTAYIIEVKKGNLFIKALSRSLKLFLDDNSIVINLTKTKNSKKRIDSLNELILFY